MIEKTWLGSCGCHEKHSKDESQDKADGKHDQAIDDGAEKALGSGKSLLPAGVRRLTGTFDRGDAVVIRRLDGTELGRGLVAYANEAKQRLLGVPAAVLEEHGAVSEPVAAAIGYGLGLTARRLVLVVDFGGWYLSLIRGLQQGVLSEAECAVRVREIAQMERMWALEGVRVLKIWLYLDAEGQQKRLAEQRADPDRSWKITAFVERNVSIHGPGLGSNLIMPGNGGW